MKIEQKTYQYVFRNSIVFLFQFETSDRDLCHITVLTTRILFETHKNSKYDSFHRKSVAIIVIVLLLLSIGVIIGSTMMMVVVILVILVMMIIIMMMMIMIVWWMTSHLMMISTVLTR